MTDHANARLIARLRDALRAEVVGTAPMSWRGEIDACGLCGAYWYNGSSSRPDEAIQPETHTPDCVLYEPGMPQRSQP
jgi:hypothetical protein